MLAFLIGLPLLDDYGTTWDFGQVVYGERYLDRLLGSGPEVLDFETPRPGAETRHPDLDQHRTEGPDLVWPLGPMLAAATHRLLPLPPIAGYHAAALLATAGLIGFLYWFLAPRLGTGGTLLGLVFLALHPGYLWHSLANFKDPVAAALYVISSLLLVEALKEQSARRFLTGSIVFGLALAAKGNALFIPATVAVALWAGHGRAAVFRVLRPRRLLVAILLGGLVVVPLTAFAFWPWLWQDLSGHLARHFDAVWHNRSGSGETLGGLLYGLATMPEVLLAGLILSVPLLRSVPAARILLALAAVPLLQASWPGAKHYDGIRRYLEFVPPFALLAGAGWVHLLGSLTTKLSPPGRRAVALGGGVVLSVLLLVPVRASHPDQHLYFNHLVGGAAGARARGLHGAIDFWGHSYRRVFEWLGENAPPGASVLTPTGPQVARLCNEMWGRPDLRLLGSELWSAEDVPPGVWFVALVYRPEYFNLIALALLNSAEPVFQVHNEGVTLAQVWRIEADATEVRTLVEQAISWGRAAQEKRIEEARQIAQQRRRRLDFVRLARQVGLLHGYAAAHETLVELRASPDYEDCREEIDVALEHVRRQRPFFQH